MEASQLLVGLADGTAVSFKFKDDKDASGRVVSLKEEKVITLGELPVFLTACKAENKDALFACGSRASILSWENQTLQHSAVNLKVRLSYGFRMRDEVDQFQDIVAAAWLNTARFKSCLVLATPSGLLIGKVKEIDKMHIRSVGVSNFFGFCVWLIS